MSSRQSGDNVSRSFLPILLCFIDAKRVERLLAATVSFFCPLTRATRVLISVLFPLFFIQSIQKKSAWNLMVSTFRIFWSHFPRSIGGWVKKLLKSSSFSSKNTTILRCNFFCQYLPILKHAPSFGVVFMEQNKKKISCRNLPEGCI